MREVRLQVPAQVPDAQVEVAVEMGSLAAQILAQNGMVVFFPTSVEDPATKQRRRAIGHAAIPILQPADIKRLLQLAQTIATVNTQIAQAARSGIPGAHVNAAITGEVTKDNATRDLVAQAEGKAGGIIIATD